MIDSIKRKFFLFLFNNIVSKKNIKFVPNSSVCIYHEMDNELDNELPSKKMPFWLIQYDCKKEIYEYKGSQLLKEQSAFFEETRKNHNTKVDWFGLAQWNENEECFVVETNQGIKKLKELNINNVWFNCLTSHRMKKKNLMSTRQAHLQAVENY